MAGSALGFLSPAMVADDVGAIILACQMSMPSLNHDEISKAGIGKGGEELIS